MALGSSTYPTHVITGTVRSLSSSVFMPHHSTIHPILLISITHYFNGAKWQRRSCYGLVVGGQRREGSVWLVRGSGGIEGAVAVERCCLLLVVCCVVCDDAGADWGFVHITAITSMTTASTTSSTTTSSTATSSTIATTSYPTTPPPSSSLYSSTPQAICVLSSSTSVVQLARLNISTFRMHPVAAS
jgi:hypothetical protein